ncbi:uncharacterized protein LOC144440516 [Glandiceps talaboti]
MLLRCLLLLGVISLTISLEVVVRERQTARVGDDDVILYCIYKDGPGNPTTSVVEWKKTKVGGLTKRFLVRKEIQQGETTTSDVRYSIVNKASLKITSVTLEDAGEYWCIVRFVVEGNVVVETTNTTLIVKPKLENLTTVLAHTESTPSDGNEVVRLNTLLSITFVTLCVFNLIFN